MKITRTQMEERVKVTVIHIDGKLNETDPLFMEAKAAYDEGARYMLFDLTNVPYISSAGFKAFHEIQNLLRHGTDTQNQEPDGNTFSPNIKLLNPSPLVSEVLKILGFDQYLETHSDLETAVASF